MSDNYEDDFDSYSSSEEYDKQIRSHISVTKCTEDIDADRVYCSNFIDGIDILPYSNQSSSSKSTIIENYSFIPFYKPLTRGQNIFRFPNKKSIIVLNSANKREANSFQSDRTIPVLFAKKESAFINPRVDKPITKRGSNFSSQSNWKPKCRIIISSTDKEEREL
jgi:hypothetical protein